MGEEVWRYHRGAWSSMESPVDLFDDSGDLVEAPVGYSSRTRWFGDEGGFQIEVYSADLESETEAPTPYLAIVYNVGDNVEHVFVDDFPSLLQLLREMAPVLDLTNWESEDEFEEDEDDLGGL